MTNSSTSALGRSRRVYVKTEAAFGTYLAPAGTDAVKVLEYDVKFDPGAGESRAEASATRTAQSFLTKPHRVTWSMKCNLTPSGTAGTPPDIHDLLCASLGGPVSGYTNTPGTSDAYFPADGQDALGSLSITDEANELVQRCLYGAWVDEVTIEQSGADDPTITFSGGAKGCLVIGNAAITAVTNVGATQDDLTVAAADLPNYQVGGVVQLLIAATLIARTTNNNAGFTIAAVDSATNKVRVTGTAAYLPSATGGIATDLLVPFCPTETTTGIPAFGTAGSCKLDTVAMEISGGSVKWANGIKGRDGESHNEEVPRYMVGRRVVTAGIKLFATRSQIAQLTKHRAHTAQALEWIFGSGAGARCKVACSYVRQVGELGIELPVGTDDEGVINFSGQAYHATVAAGELTVTFY